MATEVTAVLSDCPGAEHIVWLLSAWAPDAPGLAPESVTEHVALGDDIPAEQYVAWQAQTAAGGQAMTEVLGWRLSAFGDVVVTYRGRDERLYDCVSRVDPASGRLFTKPPMRSSNGVDIGVKLVGDLTPADWAGVRETFTAGFEHADTTYVDRRLGELGAVALGWKDGVCLGFSAVGLVQAELPMIGARSFLDCGLTCVRPEAHQLGLSSALGTSAMMAAPRTGPNEFAVLHFATPVTLRATFRFGTAKWPGTTIAEVAASMASPNPCQKAVGAALAEMAGAKAYDAERWIMRSGRPFGETTAAAADLDPLYAQLFAHVDPAQGDVLLGVFWWTDPPAVWWQAGRP